jgi:hypothetical protein
MCSYLFQIIRERLIPLVCIVSDLFGDLRNNLGPRFVTTAVSTL